MTYEYCISTFRVTIRGHRVASTMALWQWPLTDFWMNWLTGEHEKQAAIEVIVDVVVVGASFQIGRRNCAPLCVCVCVCVCACFLVFVWACIAWVGWAGSRWTGSGCGLAAKTLPDSNERRQQQWVRKREKGTGAAYALDVIYSLLIIVSSRTCANTFRSFRSAFCCCCCAKASG